MIGDLRQEGQRDQGEGVPSGRGKTGPGGGVGVSHQGP